LFEEAFDVGLRVADEVRGSRRLSELNFTVDHAPDAERVFCPEVQPAARRLGNPENKPDE
jgi:hypothetical protein